MAATAQQGEGDARGEGKGGGGGAKGKRRGGDDVGPPLVQCARALVASAARQFVPPLVIRNTVLLPAVLFAAAAVASTVCAMSTCLLAAVEFDESVRNTTTITVYEWTKGGAGGAQQWPDWHTGSPPVSKEYKWALGTQLTAMLVAMLGLHVLMVARCYARRAFPPIVARAAMLAAHALLGIVSAGLCFGAHSTLQPAAAKPTEAPFNATGNATTKTPPSSTTGDVVQSQRFDNYAWAVTDDIVDELHIVHADTMYMTACLLLSASLLEAALLAAGLYRFVLFDSRARLCTRADDAEGEPTPAPPAADAHGDGAEQAEKKLQ